MFIFWLGGLGEKGARKAPTGTTPRRVMAGGSDRDDA